MDHCEMERKQIKVYMSFEVKGPVRYIKTNDFKRQAKQTELSWGQSNMVTCTQGGHSKYYTNEISMRGNVR